MLRRKRGADYDLSDSDDGGEARRRMKRRQFAKMQKALFADERVSKVAENPRNQAFLRTIEDVGSDDEMDFLFEPPPAQAAKDSQQSSNETQGDQGQMTVPDSQPAAAAAMSAPARRAPASNRRTRDGKKPSNIGEIRETLSNLLDEPSGNTVISATDPGSDSDGDGDEGGSSNKENTNPRRTRHAGPVVDRISLKRQGSSNASSNGSNGGGSGSGRLAFAAPSSSGGSGGFRVPALLRKATTNSLMGSTGPAAAAATGGGAGGGFGEGAKIKKNAGKRSGISYLARENDRRAAVEEAEKRREQRKFRAVEGRSKVVGGLFGAGKFE
jgi:mediator of replication checkpoint protein 1